MERITSLIAQLRRLMGDEFERGTADIITNYLTQDGTGWTAQAMATAVVLSANEIIETAVTTLKSPEKVARMFGEHMRVQEMSASYVGGEGTYSRYTLPTNFGWALGGRYQRDGYPRKYVVSFEESIRHVDSAIAAVNGEDSFRPIAWVENEHLCVTLGGPTLVMQDLFNFRFITLQPAVDVTGTQDIIMRARWDRHLLAGARKALVEFKQ